MNELTFKIEYRPHSLTCHLPWLIDAQGVERLASPEEAQMYAILERYAEQEQEQHEEARQGRKRR